MGRGRPAGDAAAAGERVAARQPADLYELHMRLLEVCQRGDAALHHDAGRAGLRF